MQGVNREFDELKKEYCYKCFSEFGVAESGMPSLLLAEKAFQHIANVKDLLSHYIESTDDGQIKAFVWYCD